MEKGHAGLKFLGMILILLPGVAIIFGPFVGPILNPDPASNAPVISLIQGDAYASCNPPFNRQVNISENKSLTAKCEIVGGRDVWNVKVEEPHGDDPRKWYRDGVLLEFPLVYAHRYNGMAIDVDIAASCTQCKEPLKVTSTGQLYAGRDWQEARFADKLTTQTVTINLPEKDEADLTLPLQIVIDPYQTAPNAVVRIASVTVRPSAQQETADS